MPKYHLEDFKKWSESKDETRSVAGLFRDNDFSIENGELFMNGRPLLPNALFTSSLKRIFEAWKTKIDITDLKTKLNLVQTKLQQWTNLLNKN